ncbi:MAG TPA: SDR family oxidoreductase [Acidimicrobiales bacterium]|jgi:NAD(P)-dependent dehydrogenase (short-subunit alcohol dehydrogenase family)|nr:SDR family oxidoreductase [Acidimicrobiales bacterium]
MRVLLTGAGSGMGRCIAGHLATRGHEVVATARRPEVLDDLDVAERHALDVTSDESVARLAARIGSVDVLVNNAGINQRGPVERVPVARFRELYETNVLGVVRVAQAFVAAMRERGSGVIVNISSVAGRVTEPLGGAYAASKAALEAVSEALYYELGHFGIRVVIIEPGFIAPGMQSQPPIGEEAPYDELRRQLSGVDQVLTGGGRPGPEIVADAVAAAIEDPSCPLRCPVGADAEMVTGARSSLDDAAFEAAMREVLDLTW